MPVFFAVFSTASRISCCTPAGSSLARPRNRMRILFRWISGISWRRYSRRSCIRKSVSVFGRRQFSTENAYSVSASMFSRAQVSIVVPAGARQVLALRPAAVPVHDDRDVPREPRQVELGQQFRFVGSDWPEGARIGYGNGGVRCHCLSAFPRNSLYAAKLTYAARLTQWRMPCDASTRGSAALKNGGVGQNQAQNNHGDGRCPGHYVEGCGVHVFAHQVATVHQQ